MIRKAKGLKLINLISTNQFVNQIWTHLCSNMFLIMKIMDFENVALTKVVHIYVIEGINALYIYDIKSICSQNVFINQHRSETCYVKSLEKDFYLVAHCSF